MFISGGGEKSTKMITLGDHIDAIIINDYNNRTSTTSTTTASTIKEGEVPGKASLLSQINSTSMPGPGQTPPPLPPPPPPPPQLVTLSCLPADPVLSPSHPFTLSPPQLVTLSCLPTDPVLSPYLLPPLQLVTLSPPPPPPTYIYHLQLGPGH